MLGTIFILAVFGGIAYAFRDEIVATYKRLRGE